eukprot:jgi/Hompol1/1439/HPOL_004351-RA
MPAKEKAERKPWLPQVQPLHVYPKAAYANDGIHTDESNVATLYVLPLSRELGTSQDAVCLKYQTYLQFARYPHKVVEHHEHNFSPSGRLPALRTADGRLLGSNEIYAEVKSKGHPESSLSKDDAARLEAFLSLIESRLGFAMEYEFWYTEHFENVTAPFVGSAYPWPLSFVIPRIERSSRVSWMLSKKPVLKTEEIRAEASRTLKDLSQALGNNQYFFESTPTIVDATLFAHLHTIMSMLKQSISDSQLRSLILEHDNLVKYARRVWTTWYTPDGR